MTVDVRWISDLVKEFAPEARFSRVRLTGHECRVSIERCRGAVALLASPTQVVDAVAEIAVRWRLGRG